MEEKRILSITVEEKRILNITVEEKRILGAYIWFQYKFSAAKETFGQLKTI